MLSRPKRPYGFDGEFEHNDPLAPSDVRSIYSKTEHRDHEESAFPRIASNFNGLLTSTVNAIEEPAYEVLQSWDGKKHSSSAVRTTRVSANSDDRGRKLWVSRAGSLHFWRQ